ncbi:peptidoglycan-binding domain-containing protein [Streptomyces hesseae]|uniref:Peptidoglycan-binding domain-containing protein n=1 Tax=Streptomyces hesseae TaxID=3075519 RepID=A0ABU2SVE8_9ACTN|nr:peptidoglycan-binding domain-containing protein [Streptomyces sp. DSM 40473]MDT0451970.1 peptidoglycan-binding domain-containing protein [Streptomyces sp. DSM 40473]
MFKKYAAKAGLVVGTAALVAGGLAGTANAAEGAGYVGSGYTTSGSAVWCVQHQVNSIAAKVGRAQIAEDGKWGPRTKDQVVWYQNWVGADADGIVGPTTGDYLLRYGDQYYGGQSGYCAGLIPSDSRLGGMYVSTHLD